MIDFSISMIDSSIFMRSAMQGPVVWFQFTKNVCLKAKYINIYLYKKKEPNV